MVGAEICACFCYQICIICTYIVHVSIPKLNIEELNRQQQQHHIFKAIWEWVHTQTKQQTKKSARYCCKVCSDHIFVDVVVVVCLVATVRAAFFLQFRLPPHLPLAQWYSVRFFSHTFCLFLSLSLSRSCATLCVWSLHALAFFTTVRNFVFLLCL